MGLYASEMIYLVTPILSPADSLTLHVNHDDCDDPDLYPQVIEALADGAVMMGLPRALATEQVEKNKQNQRNRQKN